MSVEVKAAFHIRGQIDLGICYALSGERSPASIHGTDIAGAPRHLLCDAAGKSSVACQGHDRLIKSEIMSNVPVALLGSG